MKLTTKLLIISLITLSFFMPEQKNIIQTNTSFVVASDTEVDYEEKTDTGISRPYSLQTTKLM